MHIRFPRNSRFFSAWLLTLAVFPLGAHADLVTKREFSHKGVIYIEKKVLGPNGSKVVTRYRKPGQAKAPAPGNSTPIGNTFVPTKIASDQHQRDVSSHPGAKTSQPYR